MKNQLHSMKSSCSAGRVAKAIIQSLGEGMACIKQKSQNASASGFSSLPAIGGFLVGGPDETRTRDPRRDRAIF